MYQSNIIWMAFELLEVSWICMEQVKVTQSCPILCNPMDYTVHGILQARILECVALSFSWGSSQPRNQTQVYHIAGGFFTSWAIREAQSYEVIKKGLSSAMIYSLKIKLHLHFAITIVITLEIINALVKCI